MAGNFLLDTLFLLGTPLTLSVVFTIGAFVATLLAYFQHISYEYKTTNFRDVKGKVVLITGASDGIGRETALELASRGARVIICSNQRRKGLLIEEEIGNLYGKTNVIFYEMDLGCFESIKKFSNFILATEPTLDVLINNAGVLLPSLGAPTLNKQGIEIQMAVNHLGHFLLTILLLPLLRKSKSARIVNLSSSAHQFGELDRNNFEKCSNKSSFRCYGDSKLAVTLFTFELARRLVGSGITVNCLNPGYVRTNIVRRFPNWVQTIHHYCMFLFCNSPKQGADTSLFLTLSKDVNEITGKYFTKRKMVDLRKLENDQNFGEALWKWSEKKVEEFFNTPIENIAKLN